MPFIADVASAAQLISCPTCSPLILGPSVIALLNIVVALKIELVSPVPQFSSDNRSFCWASPPPGVLKRSLAPGWED